MRFTKSTISSYDQYMVSSDSLDFDFVLNIIASKSADNTSKSVSFEKIKIKCKLLAPLSVLNSTPGKTQY